MAGLEVTQLAALGVHGSPQEIGERLAPLLAAALERAVAA
jgi:hypothetical protein